MKRKEFQVTDDGEIEAFLHDAPHGFLAFQREGAQGDAPGLTPLNFVYHGGALYFHMGGAGERIRSLKKNSAVTFSAALEYAILPSYFSDPDAACYATNLSKSVVARGQARQVESLDEKREALTALMKKYQPEGGHQPFSDSIYDKILGATVVLKMEIESMEAKFRAGQHLSAERREKVLEGLKKRNSGTDSTAAEMVEKYKK